jgi:hypothetical protein
MANLAVINPLDTWNRGPDIDRAKRLTELRIARRAAWLEAEELLTRRRYGGEAGLRARFHRLAALHATYQTITLEILALELL